MGKTKKLIELEDKTIAILEEQAKLQKRSLKNYLEFMIEDRALYFSKPSEEYKAMMDDMLKRQENGEIKWISSEEVRKRYGR
ncbi:MULTISPECIES: hypothetical protein [Aequorivita]|uniref:CopG family transcriptional regulator n=1 Tax=Aequorivita iocasae TaxID=2803865 RepID=A0ABX7DVB5_9FLAO|nr:MULTISPECIES: hypothetical protein [Aequorivita]QQX78080.1 hypothetical protein JK629_07425 [Aequorivita iocasae]UCA57588.1 hypothetical protein LDL78_07465 [Aequorivita sp. F7]